MRKFRLTILFTMVITGLMIASVSSCGNGKAAVNETKKEKPTEVVKVADISFGEVFSENECATAICQVLIKPEGSETKMVTITAGDWSALSKTERVEKFKEFKEMMQVLNVKIIDDFLVELKGNDVTKLSQVKYNLGTDKVAEEIVLYKKNE